MEFPSSVSRRVPFDAALNRSRAPTPPICSFTGQRETERVRERENFTTLDTSEGKVLDSGVKARKSERETVDEFR